MTTSALTTRAELVATKQAAWVTSAALLILGFYWAPSLSDFLAYLIVVGAALLPTILWIRLGRVGVPILPAVATLHILYYAVPMVRGREDLVEYSGGDILRAAGTVALYLVVAAFSAYHVQRRRERAASPHAGLLSDAQMNALVFLGLGLGILFLAASSAGLLWSLGVFFGLVRSIALTAMMTASYFLGVARGKGSLRGMSWFLACTGLGLAIAISWSSLFLVGGLTFLLAASVGYVTTRGRIPWLIVGAAVVLVSILHAGKEEMRGRYWRQEGAGGQASLLSLPRLALEWFRVGLESVGSSQKGRSALDRASLLQILLRAQLLTPSNIDYLRGETYALLPGMLIPRFLNPGKTKSQAGMDMLNIRYGLLTVEGTEKTAVGWGLISEGYANFGYLGVAGIGELVGLAAGWLTRWSARGSTVSVPTLLAVAALVGLINLEQDLSGLVTSLLQSVGAVFVFVAFLRLFPKRSRRAGDRRPLERLG